VVVTHEQPENPNKKRKTVKIPDACRDLSVGWADPFKMLRNKHANFVLGTPSKAPPS
jgi:hypothetical protein